MSRRKEIFKEADIQKKIDDVEKSILELSKGVGVLETLHSPSYGSGYKADGWYRKLHDELEYKIKAFNEILKLSKFALKQDEEHDSYGRNMEWINKYKSKIIKICV